MLEYAVFYIIYNNTLNNKTAALFEVFVFNVTECVMFFSLSLLQSLPDKEGKKCLFIIKCTDKSFEISASDKKKKQEWIQGIAPSFSRCSVTAASERVSSSLCFLYLCQIFKTS